MDMLESVGNAVAIIGDIELEVVAKQRGWKCLYAATPNSETVVRGSSGFPKKAPL